MWQGAPGLAQDTETITYILRKYKNSEGQLFHFKNWQWQKGNWEMQNSKYCQINYSLQYSKLCKSLNQAKWTWKKHLEPWNEKMQPLFQSHTRLNIAEGFKSAVLEGELHLQNNNNHGIAVRQRRNCGGGSERGRIVHTYSVLRTILTSLHQQVWTEEWRNLWYCYILTSNYCFEKCKHNLSFFFS